MSSSDKLKFIENFTQAKLKQCTHCSSYQTTIDNSFRFVIINLISWRSIDWHSLVSSLVATTYKKKYGTCVNISFEEFNITFQTFNHVIILVKANCTFIKCLIGNHLVEINKSFILINKHV